MLTVWVELTQSACECCQFGQLNSPRVAFLGRNSATISTPSSDKGLSLQLFLNLSLSSVEPFHASWSERAQLSLKNNAFQCVWLVQLALSNPAGFFFTLTTNCSCPESIPAPKDVNTLSKSCDDWSKGSKYVYCLYVLRQWSRRLCNFNYIRISFQWNDRNHTNKTLWNLKHAVFDIHWGILSRQVHCTVLLFFSFSIT